MLRILYIWICLVGVIRPIIAQPDAASWYQQGILAVKSGDYRRGGALLQRAAESGHRQAMLRLAVMYERGLGTSKDLEKAQHWRKKAEVQPETKSEPKVLPKSTQTRSRIAQSLLDQSEFHLERQEFESALSYADASLFVSLSPWGMHLRLQALEALNPNGFALLDKEYELAISNWSYGPILNGYGRLLLRQGLYQDAVSVFKDALGSESTDSLATFLGLAECHVLLKQRDEASHWLNMAEEIANGHEDIVRLRGLMEN